MSPFKRAQTAPPVIKYHWLHGIDPNPKRIRWFEDDSDDSDLEQQDTSRQEAHPLDQLDQELDRYIAPYPDQNAPSNQANMASEKKIKKEAHEAPVKKEENGDHEANFNGEQHDEHEAKKIKRESGGPPSDANWHPSRGPVPSPSVIQRARSIAPPSSRIQAPSGPSRSRAKSIAPRRNQSQSVAGPSRPRVPTRDRVNAGSGGIQDAEIALWEQDFISIPEQHRLWDLVSAREPRLRNIKAHILASTEPNLARHVLSQRLIDLRCERWTKDGILNSSAGASSTTAEKKAIVASQVSSSLVEPAAPASHTQELLRTSEAVASGSATMASSEQEGESSKQKRLASGTAASTSVDDTSTQQIEAQVPTTASLPETQPSKVKLSKLEKSRAKRKAKIQRKKIAKQAQKSNNETPASEGESSKASSAKALNRNMILSSESSILPPIPASTRSQLVGNKKDLYEIARLEAVTEKSKSQSKRLKELEELNWRDMSINNGSSRDTFANNGESSRPAARPVNEASVQKTKAQRRKERLEQERLDRKKMVATGASASNVHAAGSQSLIKNDAENEKSKGSKKRKRAASNASVTLSQLDPTLKISSDSAQSSRLPKNEQKEKKKKKKKDLAHQSRRDMFDGNVEKVNKDAVKKSKEKNGKTVSKKRQKREAQQAVHALEVATKKAPVQSKKRKLQDLPNDATSKKQKLNHVQDKAIAQARFVPSGFDPSDPDSSDSSDDDKPGSDAESESHSDFDDAESSDEDLETPAKAVELLSKQAALYKTIMKGCGPGRIDSSPDTAQITPSKKAVPRPIAVSPVPVPLTFGSQKQRTAPSAIAPIETRKTEVTPTNPQINTSAEVVDAITELQKTVRHLSNAFSTALSPNAMEWSPTATNFTPTAAVNVSEPKVKKTRKRKAIEVEENVQDDSIIDAGMNDSDAGADDWETVKGKLKASMTDRLGNDIRDTVAVSGAHIAKKELVTIADTTFWPLSLAADEEAVLRSDSKKSSPKARLCVVIEGKATVVLHYGDGEIVLFEISKGGVFRVKKGETAEIYAIDKGKGKQKEGTPIVLIHVIGIN